MADSPTDRVKERIDIVALISESFPLKRAGSNFKAKCPFHAETAASFTVSPRRQTFRCFGCGKSGDIFSWLMEREGMTFPEALRVLAQRAGVPLTFDRPERREERERLRATLDLAATFYHRILTEAAAGKAALQYLHERGMTAATIAEWRLGYCPPTPTGIVEKARERGVGPADLAGAGIVGQRENRTYEFFAGRILFPLADHHGSVVGLAGRVFGDEHPDRPKYINSPETALYKKGAVLYGLHHAKEAIRTNNLAVLVEGYTDVIASHQCGVANVVATAGTALTDDHLRLLRRFTDRLAFAFDADAAGGTATRRALDLALEAGFTLSVVTLPAGTDPADLALRDPDGWKRAIAARSEVFTFLLDRARSLYRLEMPEGKRDASADLLPVVARVQNAVVQGDYAQQLAAALGVDVRFVYDDLRRVASRESRVTSHDARLKTPDSRLSTPVVDPDIRREERFVTLLLAEPALIPKAAVVLAPAALLSPQTRALYSALLAWYGQEHAEPASPGRSPAEFREQLPEDLRAHLEALLFAVETERENEDWDPAAEAGPVCRALLLGHLRRELRARTSALARASGDERAEQLRSIAALTDELARAEHVWLEDVASR